MDFYSLNLAVFVAGNGYLLYRQYQRQQDEVVEELKQEASGADYGSDGEAEHQGSLLGTDTKAAARQFQLDYFPVYALAMAADWLQVLCWRRVVRGSQADVRRALISMPFISTRRTSPRRSLLRSTPQALFLAPSPPLLPASSLIDTAVVSLASRTASPTS